MVVAASRNHLYRRRLQVVIDAGPRNHLYLLGQQVKIRSSPRNQYFEHQNAPDGNPLGRFCVCGYLDVGVRQGVGDVREGSGSSRSHFFSVYLHI